jgi:hypothetical protein
MKKELHLLDETTLSQFQYSLKPFVVGKHLIARIIFLIVAIEWGVIFRVENDTDSFMLMFIAKSKSKMQIDINCYFFI